MTRKIPELVDNPLENRQGGGLANAIVSNQFYIMNSDFCLSLHGLGVWFWSAVDRVAPCIRRVNLRLVRQPVWGQRGDQRRRFKSTGPHDRLFPSLGRLYLTISFGIGPFRPVSG